MESSERLARMHRAIHLELGSACGFSLVLDENILAVEQYLEMGWRAWTGHGSRGAREEELLATLHRCDYDINAATHLLQSLAQGEAQYASLFLHHLQLCGVAQRSSGINTNVNKSSRMHS